MSIDSPEPAAPLDPALLVAFRREAAPILAQERGLTPAGRAKLAGLARQMGVAEDQIDDAIRSLGQSAPPPVTENPLVEKFRRRLRKDLAGKSRSILGPTIEEQIVAAAGRKYGLDAGVTRQVLGEVAAELGLRRISANQAIDSLAAQIDQAAGDATWLAREVWDRLRTAGGKWGIELEVVDQLIDERLAANKAQHSRRRFAVRATLIGAGGTLAVVAVVLAILAIHRNQPVEPVSTPGASTPPGVATSASKPAAPPAWWDVDLTIAVANARSKFKDIEPNYSFLISAAPADRAAAYRKLGELAGGASPPAGQRTALADVLAGCYALEPDETAAGEVVASLAGLIPAADAPLPKGRGEYIAAYWAGETLVQLGQRNGLPLARRQALEAAGARSLGLSLGGPATRPDQERAARNAVTRRLFAQLTAAAARQPADVARLFGYLTDLAADLSDEEFARLEATFLAAALPAAGDDWQHYQEATVRTVSSPDPLSVLKILEAYQRSANPELKQRLAELLVARTGVRPKSWDPPDVVAAVRKGLGAAGSAAAVTQHERWQMLKLRADAALARPAPADGDHAALLAQTVELTHLTTLAIALAQGDAGQAVFDAAIDKPPQLDKPRSPGDAGGPDLPPPRRPGAVPARDERAAERWIDLVAGYARRQPVERESNFRGLAQQVERLPDLTPHQAAKVAEYVLAEKSDQENQAVVQAIGPLRRWKRLRLAVADGLAASKLTPVQLRPLVASLLDTAPAADGVSSGELRQMLLQSVLAELETSTSLVPSAPTDRTWRIYDDAADQLLESYRTRARLFSLPPQPLAAANSPAKALYLSLDPLAASLRLVADSDDARNLARLPHEANAWGYLCGDDLHRTAAINRVLVELSARRAARMKPTQAAAAERIAAELSAGELAAANVLSQLRQQEAAHLKIWMLYAPPL